MFAVSHLGDEPSLIVAKKYPVRIDLSRGREIELHGGVQLLGEHSHAKNAEKHAGAIGDGLQDADLDARLVFRHRGVEL